MKKIKIISISLLLVASVFITVPVFATESGQASASTESVVVNPMGAGEWDAIGTDVFSNKSKVVKSYGGDFKVEMSNHSDPESAGTYYVYEQDLVSDDRIKSIYLAPGYEVAFPVGFWVDGDTAELYLVQGSNASGEASVTFWD